jgi:hypothetical protein
MTPEIFVIAPRIFICYSDGFLSLLAMKVNCESDSVEILRKRTDVRFIAVELKKKISDTKRNALKLEALI